MRGICLLALGTVSITVAGCAFTAQSVNLQPTPHVAAGNVGKGHTVYVNTIDERPTNVIGHRGAGSVGSEITPAYDVAKVVGKSVSDGLRQLGFTTVEQASPDATQLRVEVRNLDYLVSQGFWAGGLTVDVSLKGICIIGESRPYEHLYRGHHEENIQVVQTQAENEEYINAALTEAIEQVLGDSQLMSCLARGPA